MRYISDDKKVIGTKEEVEKYENEQKEKKKLTEEKEKMKEALWEKIQAQINALNANVKKYKELGGFVTFRICNGNFVAENNSYGLNKLTEDFLNSFSI